jgi:hypothetical protein
MQRGMSWLARPIACEDVIVLEALDAEHLSSTDLREICLRMDVILQTIEMSRCEGRLMPVEIFDRIEKLADLVLHGWRPPLTDWTGLICEFGEHYGLSGDGPIPVDPAVYQNAVERFNVWPDRH